MHLIHQVRSFSPHTSVSSVSCPPPAAPIPPVVGPWEGVPPFHSLSSSFFRGVPAVWELPKRLSLLVAGLFVPAPGPPVLLAMPCCASFLSPRVPKGPSRMSPVDTSEERSPLEGPSLYRLPPSPPFLPLAESGPALSHLSCSGSVRASCFFLSWSISCDFVAPGFAQGPRLYVMFS